MKWTDALPALLTMREKGTPEEQGKALDQLREMAAAADAAQRPRLGSMDNAHAVAQNLIEKYPDKVVYSTRHPASGEWSTGATTRRTFFGIIQPKATPGNLWTHHMPAAERVSQ